MTKQRLLSSLFLLILTIFCCYIAVNSVKITFDGNMNILDLNTRLEIYKNSISRIKGTDFRTKGEAVSLNVTEVADEEVALLETRGNEIRKDDFEELINSISDLETNFLQNTFVTGEKLRNFSIIITKITHFLEDQIEVAESDFENEKLLIDKKCNGNSNEDFSCDKSKELLDSLEEDFESQKSALLKFRPRCQFQFWGSGSLGLGLLGQKNHREKCTDNSSVDKALPNLNKLLSRLHLLTSIILPMIFGLLGGLVRALILTLRSDAVGSRLFVSCIVGIGVAPIAASFGSSFIELFEFETLPLTIIALYLLIGLIGFELFDSVRLLCLKVLQYE